MNSTPPSAAADTSTPPIRLEGFQTLELDFHRPYLANSGFEDPCYLVVASPPFFIRRADHSDPWILREMVPERVEVSTNSGLPDPTDNGLDLA